MTETALPLVIEPTSADPPYDQIRVQVTRLVDSGSLAPGVKLPTVRALAQEMGVATNTVARAYRELEHRGVIVTRGRLGTFVSGRSADRAAKEAAAGFVEQMRALDLDDGAILEHVRRGLAPPKSS